MTCPGLVGWWKNQDKGYLVVIGLGFLYLLRLPFFVCLKGGVVPCGFFFGSQLNLSSVCHYCYFYFSFVKEGCNSVLSQESVYSFWLYTRFLKSYLQEMVYLFSSSLIFPFINVFQFFITA